MGAKYCRINGFRGIVLSKKRAPTVRKYCSKGTLNSDKLLKAGAGVHRVYLLVIKETPYKTVPQLHGNTSSMFDTTAYEWHITSQAFILKYQLEP